MAEYTGIVNDAHCNSFERNRVVEDNVVFQQYSQFYSLLETTLPSPVASVL